MDSSQQYPGAKPAFPARSRLLSLCELALGSIIVIGHNVLHILPNEVPILFVLGWISLRLRDGGWKAAGFTRPDSWPRTIAFAIAAVLVLQFGSELVIGPLAAHFWPAPQEVSALLKAPAYDWKHALILLALVWTFAAFGEEMSYRGYLLTRATDIGSRSALSYWLAMIFVALLFGFGHFYKGPPGVADSTWSGLVLGSVYMLSGRNLWASILAHGLSDTVAVAFVFMGWAD
ncbi:MAG: CPBP family intramembrane glutamic endopeptidase [Chthoniobacterales bacterium]